MSNAADQPATDKFVEYYAQESLSQTALQRFESVKETMLRVWAARHGEPRALQVADVGCGAATQCMLWAREGHQVRGLDINEHLLELGRKRAANERLDIDLRPGTATALPWADACVDVCLVPELLEHVADWQKVLDEACRVLRPGGALYLSTTNALCPSQEEFDLPMYSWYPTWLKRRYERLSVTTRPELVNHAKYPAVHWFTFYGLRRELATRGVDGLDRFDLLTLKHARGLKNWLSRLITSVPPLRALGHVLTPYSLIVGVKRPAN